ncbi:MAG: TIGR00180 family glycosyltransferase [Dehalococcoidia bacterium]
MITILIPTYNRPDYLKRILGYYNDFRVAYNIIVADGSSDEIKKVNKETVSSFPSLRIQHLAKYSSETHPLHRLNDALKYINTEYCVFCADDDFVTPNGIRQSVDFLEKNPDFAIAHGRYISFRLERRKNGQNFRWQPTYSALSITFEHSEQRLTYHLSNYSPTFYAIHRSELLQMIWAENVRFMNDARFSELLPSMLASIYGKVKCLDVLYAARDASSIRVGYWPTLTDAIEAGAYNETYAKFRDCLSMHLSKRSQLDIEESGQVVDEAMSAYMKKYYHPSKSKMGYISARMGHILRYLNLPDWLDRGIRRSYTRLARSRYTRKASIDMSPSSKYYDDFNRIRRHVLASSGIIAK